MSTGDTKKARVYTRTGDEGTSQLLSVGRVPKDHLRLTVYGDTDELNSLVGMAIAQGLSAPLPAQLDIVQHRLFVLGSQIAVPNPEAVGFEIPSIATADTDEIEGWIDAADVELPALKNFILPGGSQAASVLHMARTVCRRCERDLQSLHHVDPVSAPARSFVNRLSDYFFTAARYENLKRGVADVAWSART
ncbi:ATP/cobalamin adenosyltransferase [Salinisphaera dokdonensis CL-ES53]|uniref:Corrinoid adenosyltransferase n=1 Tax=Salinisphaera dokdonensis CL-ES53 TaxID=1304272 RepID=A0ABV2AZW9_9GAMM